MQRAATFSATLFKCLRIIGMCSVAILEAQIQTVKNKMILNVVILIQKAKANTIAIVRK